MELEVKAIEGCPEDEYVGLGRAAHRGASSAGSRSLRYLIGRRSRPT